MNLQRDIRPITFLKNRTADMAEMASSGRTLVITQNGEAQMVVVGVEEYDRWQSALALLRILHQSEADIAAGRTARHDELMKRVSAKIRRARSGRAARA